MTALQKARKAARLQPRLRILLCDEIAFGPGKAELLENIEKTGSLLLAAQKMRLSYMRAWTLVKTMNQCFHEPLVTLSRGGKAGGGAQLTLTGRRMLKLYRQMEQRATAATRKQWAEILKFLG